MFLGLKGEKDLTAFVNAMMTYPACGVIIGMLLFDRKEKKLRNFKLFIIMDTDDCSDKTREDYISGKLFENSCLKEYIVPIFNSPNLEEVMIKSGIIAKKIPDSQKGSYYSKIFPINQDPFSNDTLDQIRLFSRKLENVKETNLLEYVYYCLSLIDQV